MSKYIEFYQTPISVLDLRFLKIDASNDPITGDLTINANLLFDGTRKIIGGTTTTSDFTLQTTSGVGVTGADMHFLVGNNGATEAMTILNNGNVGIGTTNPVQLLQISGASGVTGATTPTLRIESTTNSQGWTAQSNFAALQFMLPNDGSGQSGGERAAIKAKVEDTTGTNIGLSFFTSSGTQASTERVRIDNSGNVGIGTIAPTSKLSVQGTTTTASLGTEKVVNGNFLTNPDTSWTWGTGWVHDTTNFEADYTGTTGAIATVANGGIKMNHGGTGYTAADVLTLTNGAGDAQVTVSTVNANGMITAWTLSGAGTANTVNASVAVTGGTGTGATFNIIKLVDSAATLSQDTTESNGQIYQVTYTIKNRTAGQVKLTIGGVAGHYVLANGTYTQVITATGTGNLTFTPTVDFTGSIDDVSVKLITTSNPVADILNSDGTVGPELRSGGTGLYNTFTGYQSGRSTTTGNYNSFLGYQAGRYNTTGSDNSFLGAQTGYYNTTGSDNSFLGMQAGLSNTTGSYNSFLGMQAGYSNTTGTQNSFVGMQAGYSNTTGIYNSFVGMQAGRYNTTGIDNSFLGMQAGYSNTTGIYNSFLGMQTGYSNTTGNYNSFLGTFAGYYNTTGISNSFVGMQTGYYNTTGTQNSFLGTQAGYYNTTGSYNSFFGRQAGYYNTTGSYNSFLGNQAGLSNTTGDYNYFLGEGAGAYSQTGSFNVAIGNRSLGYGAGVAFTGANSNTIIGYKSGYSLGTDDSGNVMLGYQAGYSETGSNKLYIANSNTTTPLIYGLFTGTGAGITIHSQATDGVPLIVKGIAGQASNLQEWQNSSASVLASVDDDGTIDTTAKYEVDGVQVVSNRVIDARIDDTSNSGDATTDGIIAAIQSILQTHGLAAAA